MPRALIIFLGPPGAGKGTQAKKLCAEMGYAHVSTGEMFRAAIASDTDLGRSVKEILDAGKLVPDELTVSIVHARLEEKDCNKGVVLDGFPRTVPQAIALEGMLAETGEILSDVVMFDVAENTVRDRLSSRAKAEGRSDDSEEVQLERIRVYRTQTAPLLDFYENSGRLKRVSAHGSIDEVYAALKSVLK